MYAVRFAEQRASRLISEDVFFISSFYVLSTVYLRFYWLIMRLHLQNLCEMLT